MLVFDLNDLKLTNDRWGHQVGDELILAFATAIKESSKMTAREPFAGRYGGDEFIVYYQSSDLAEVNHYLDEVRVRTERYNEGEDRYQISYAVGTALFSTEQNHRTLKELFDEADREMYLNKQEIKRRRAEAGHAGSR